MVTYDTHPMPEAERQLVQLCEQIGFGRIDGLAISDGRPCFTPAPTIVTEVKLGADQQMRRRPSGASLHPSVKDLLRTIALVGSGSIRSLEVRHGLPFRIELDGVLAS